MGGKFCQNQSAYTVEESVQVGQNNTGIPSLFPRIAHHGKKKVLIFYSKKTMVHNSHSKKGHGMKKETHK